MLRYSALHFADYAARLFFVTPIRIHDRSRRIPLLRPARRLSPTGRAAGADLLRAPAFRFSRGRYGPTDNQELCCSGFLVGCGEYASAAFCRRPRAPKGSGAPPPQHNVGYPRARFAPARPPPPEHRVTLPAGRGSLAGCSIRRRLFRPFFHSSCIRSLFPFFRSHDVLYSSSGPHRVVLT